MDLKDKINLDHVPEHVAIIMDGNGRWAKQQGKMRIFGHTNGVVSVRETLVAASEIGVKYLTLYAFSTENWNRPKLEVNALMDLLVKTLSKEVKSLHENGVRLRAIGDVENLPKKCYQALMEAMDYTKNNDRVNLVLALNYSSQWEIVEAVKKLAEKAANNEISPEEITSEVFANELATHNIPDPELLIRTSGEQRISNFLLWQIAYTELYFADKHWPEFRKQEFYEAIIDYQQRERRFGKISEQIAI